MAKLILDISTSLDGFIGGPNPGPEHPLGEGASSSTSGRFRPRPSARRTGNRAARRTPTRRWPRSSAAASAPP
jgi:hypothetical protein